MDTQRFWWECRYNRGEYQRISQVWYDFIDQDWAASLEEARESALSAAVTYFRGYHNLFTGLTDDQIKKKLLEGFHSPEYPNDACYYEIDGETGVVVKITDYGEEP